MKKNKVHFIAIGGSAMHNLAIALHLKGISVSGSDDEILEPSKSRLEKHGLLPEHIGWDNSKINTEIDSVVLGMHARIDNPELLEAQRIGLPVFSYPEFIYQQSLEKIRIVIGGSHGKTTITSMILHVMNFHHKSFDYLVGAQIKGFDTMVKLTEDAPLIVLEGDEYLASPIDRRPKFHLYKANIALLTGIAWDHINVFPTFQLYVDQFEIFINTIEPNGTLIYAENDENVVNLVQKSDRKDITFIPYYTPEYEIVNGLTFLKPNNLTIPLQVFGEHNLQNLEGARLVCKQIGIVETDFYEAIQSFEGAAKRMELIASNKETLIFKDFAHSPSKLKATIAAAKNQYPERKLIAAMELHTFSSLNKNFLDEYKNSMDMADEKIIYFNPHTVEHKKLDVISEQEIRTSFGNIDALIFDNTQNLTDYLTSKNLEQTNVLLMSSGNFGGIILDDFAKSLLA